MKRLLKKLIIFFLLVIFIQIVIVYFSTPSNNKTIISIKNAFKNKIDILYLGDSTVFFHSQKDKDTRTIDQILADQLSLRSITSLTHAGYTLDEYAAICQYSQKVNN